MQVLCGEDGCEVGCQQGWVDVVSRGWVGWVPTAPPRSVQSSWAWRSRCLAMPSMCHLQTDTPSVWPVVALCSFGPLWRSALPQFPDTVEAALREADRDHDGVVSMQVGPNKHTFCLKVGMAAWHASAAPAALAGGTLLRRPAGRLKWFGFLQPCTAVGTCAAQDLQEPSRQPEPA